MALVSVCDYEKQAEAVLDKKPWDYYRSGAGDEYSLKLNKEAYNKLRVRPRVLVDVSKRTTKTNVLGLSLSMPVGIAPTAMHRMAHCDGEKATARAAGKANTVFIMSTLSTTSIEDVAAAAPDTHKWFQLYIYKDRELTKSLVRRAETAGFKAIVLTVDAPIFGTRRADVRNKFTLPEHLELANFKDDKVFVKSVGGSGLNEYVTKQFDATINWNDVQWLVKFSKLPIILKGIITKEDALLALSSGCKGIIVSNHGARQLDSVPATIEALPEIAQAVGDKLIVMIDGGVRNGVDAFKAIALGAKMIFVGRPAIFGLAVSGQSGVEEILNILKNDLDLAMALAGVCSIKEINNSYIVHKSYYHLSKL